MNLRLGIVGISLLGTLCGLGLAPIGCAAGNDTNTTVGSAGSAGMGTGGNSSGDGGMGTGGGFVGGAGGEGGVPPVPLDRWIAFDSDRDTSNRDIYVMRPDGTSVKRMTTEAFTDREPAFSHDGTRIAFASDRTDLTMQIYIMKLPSLEITQLTHRMDGADQPAWSMDDKTIAFHSGASFYTIGIDGTNEKKWDEGPDLTNAFQHPTFTPDGNWILADRGNWILAYKLDGSLKKDIAPNVPNTQQMPTVAPTGALVAFATYCGTEQAILLTPISGFTGDACTTLSRLSPMGLRSTRPSWGPWGFVAFEGGPDGSADIYVVPEKGGEAVNITNEMHDDRNPAWSPPEGAPIPF